MAGPPQPGAAQVFLRDAGLRFDAEGVDVLHYSQAARLLLAVCRGSITAYSIDRPSEPPQVQTSHQLDSCATSGLLPAQSDNQACLLSNNATPLAGSTGRISRQICHLNWAMLVGVVIVNPAERHNHHGVLSYQRVFDTIESTNLLQVTEMEPGPPIVAAAVSPDGRLVALQRTPERLEFVSRDSPNLFVQSALRGKHAITGFFWARASGCDFVMVTNAGLELYTLAADRQVT